MVRHPYTLQCSFLFECKSTAFLQKKQTYTANLLKNNERAGIFHYFSSKEKTLSLSNWLINHSFYVNLHYSITYTT